MEKIDRRQAIRAYKEREETGGIYRLVNTASGWEGPLTATTNLQGQVNRLQFAKSTNTPLDHVMRAQFAQYGADAFELRVVEQLEKKPGQSVQEFKEDIMALLALYQEEK